MEMILIESRAYYQLLEASMKFLEEKRNPSGKEIVEEKLYITQAEAQKLLPYKSRTSWQRIRDLHLVEYSKVGRVLLYSKPSLLRYIAKHQVK